jgi:uncharacterized cofD-like protein
VKKYPKIVCLGGGTGTYTVLKGLKRYPVHLSAIVSMTDSGGSNRVLRDEFGILPTSDIRQCMVALASKESNGLIRELFNYRYNQGTGISGMTFGNLFMAALADIYKNQGKAIQKTCEILDVKGNIIPVTFDACHLVARYANGQQVLGEHAIDEPNEQVGKHRIIDLEVIPPAKANKKALQSIKQADLIILGPGDLYTSIICNLVVKNIAPAIIKSRAKKVFVINLMNRFGQTNHFRASDYLKEIEKYLAPHTIDYCLINKSKAFPKGVLVRYKQEQAAPVIDDLNSSQKPKIIRKSFVSKQVYRRQKGDKLRRSLIRHDSSRLAKAIIDLL